MLVAVVWMFVPPEFMLKEDIYVERMLNQEADRLRSSPTLVATNCVGKDVPLQSWFSHP